ATAARTRTTRRQTRNRRCAMQAGVLLVRAQASLWHTRRAKELWPDRSARKIPTASRTADRRGRSGRRHRAPRPEEATRRKGSNPASNRSWPQYKGAKRGRAGGDWSQDRGCPALCYFQPMLRFWKRAAGSLLALVLFACGQSTPPPEMTDIKGIMPGLSISMTRANDGKAVTAKDYRGKIAVLYF